MSDTYSKIDTLWDRDKETFTVIPGAYRRPEFELLKTWRVTEKVDGTNIRLIFGRAGVAWDFDDEAGTVGEMQVLTERFEIRGRTDRAQIPGPLLHVLNKLCERILPEVVRIMEEFDLGEYTLYGEGYGPGIQSGGYYRDDPAFILFDVKADSQYLSEDQVLEASIRLGVDKVPDLVNPYAQNREWEYTLLDWTEEDIVRYVQTGECLTTFAKDQREAEGIIAKTRVPMYNQRGQRVMFKLKGSDFRAGKR